MPSHVTIVSRALAIAVLLFTVTSLAESQTAATGQSKDTPPPRTGSISGHVLINNKAAAGVEVGAFGGDSFNRRVATAQSKTDSEGYYHLSGLPAANYQVTTFTPNLIATETNPQYPLGFGAFAGTSKTVLLGAGEDVNEIDIKLVRGGVITGRVTDAEDKPVVEERVNLEAVTERGQTPPNLSRQSFLGQTDDRGIYRIYGLPPGRYRVSVGQSAANGTIGPAWGFYLLTYHPEGTEVARATVIDLAAGAEASNVDIKLGRRGETHTLTGRVVDAENGLPISSVRVGLQFLRNQGQGGFTGAMATTTADGSFTIQGVMGDSRYGVYVTSEGGNSEFYSDPVVVNVTDQDVSGIELKAVHGTSISGMIVPENMDIRELLRQVPGLRVDASTFPADGLTPTAIRSFGSAPVAADGSFTITGLRPGRASFSITGRDAKRPTLVKVTVGGIGVTQGFEIERQPISGVQLVVVYGTGTIRGRLTFQGGSLTDFRTQVMCRRENSRGSQTSSFLDARGRFTITGLAPGSYDCAAQLFPLAPPAPGLPVSRPPQIPHQTVTVSNDAESEVNFAVDLTSKGVGP